MNMDFFVAIGTAIMIQAMHDFELKHKFKRTILKIVVVARQMYADDPDFQIIFGMDMTPKQDGPFPNPTAKKPF